MGFDQSAPKCPDNLNLKSNLVESCPSGVAKLSAHVEQLLAADLEQRQPNSAGRAAPGRLQAARHVITVPIEARVLCSAITP